MIENNQGQKKSKVSQNSMEKKITFLNQSLVLFFSKNPHLLMLSCDLSLSHRIAQHDLCYKFWQICCRRTLKWVCQPSGKAAQKSQKEECNGLEYACASYTYY